MEQEQVWEIIRTAFDAVKKKYQTVDVLAYNTDVLKDGFATVLSPEELAERYQVDVAGAVCAAQQVISGKDCRKILSTVYRKESDGDYLLIM